MRKGNKCLVIVIFINILITMQFAIPSHGDSTVQLTYKITKSRLIAKVDDKNLKTNNFIFSRYYFPEGTKIDVLMNYDETGMYADYTLNNLTDDFAYWTGALKIIMKQHLVHTYRLSYALTMYWNDLNELADGYPLYLYPYITPESSTWNYFAAISEEYKNFYDVLAAQGHDVSCDYTTSITSDAFIFEFWSGGNFTGLYKDVVIDSTLKNPLSISYDNLFKIVINKYTGFIEGFHIKGRTLGTLNQSHFNVSLDYQYDKLGSSMTGFTLGPNFIVDPYLGRKIGLSVGVVLGIIGITSLTVFLSLHLKKRRKGKLLNNPPNSI